MPKTVSVFSMLLLAAPLCAEPAYSWLSMQGVFAASGRDTAPPRLAADDARAPVSASALMREMAALTPAP
jgi:hypothetical protein